MTTLTEPADGDDEGHPAPIDPSLDATRHEPPFAADGMSYAECFRRIRADPKKAVSLVIAEYREELKRKIDLRIQLIAINAKD